MIQLTRQFALFKQTILNDTRSVGLQLLRFLFASLLGLIVYVAQSEASQWREIDGRYLFEIIFVLNLVFSVFAGLFLFLPMVKEEKEEDTLGMIMMTGISPFAYLFGKLGSRLLMFMLMLAVQVPVIYLCVTLGGVDVSTILMAYFFLGLLTFHLANVFLLGSLMSTSLFTGIIIAGGIALIFSYIFNFIMDFTVGMHAVDFPFAGIEDTIDEILATAAWGTTTYTYPYYFTYLVVSGIIFFFLSVYYFDTLTAEQEELEVPDKLKGKNSSEEKAESLEGIGLKPLYRKLKTKRFGKRPIIYKDFRFTSFGPLMYTLQFGTIMFIFYDVFFNHHRSFDEYNDVYRMCRDCIPTLFLICGASFLISSNLIFASEIKHKTLNSLITLPQDCDKLYFHKLVGIVKVSFPSLLALSLVSIVYLLVPSYDYYYDANRDLKSVVMIFTVLFTALFINSFLSMLFKKYSFFLSCGLTVGWFALHIFFFELLRVDMDGGLAVFLVDGFIVSLVLANMTVKQLEKYAVTS